MKIRFGISFGVSTPPDHPAGVVDYLESSKVDSLRFAESAHRPTAGSVAS